LNAKTKRTS